MEPNLREMFPSNSSDFTLGEDASGQYVEKSSKYPPLLEGEGQTQALDMLEFFLELEKDGHPNLLSPLRFDAEINSHTYELYPYIELKTYDDSRFQIIRNVLDGRLSLPGIVNFYIQLADAVAYIHDRGFIHGDVRPRNIFIAPGFSPILFDYNCLTRPHFEPESFSRFNREIPPEIGGGMTMVDARYDVFQIGYLLRDLTHHFDVKAMGWKPSMLMPESLHDIVACATGPLEGRYPDAGLMRDHLGLVLGELLNEAGGLAEQKDQPNN